MHTSCSGFSQSFTVAPQALPFTSHVGSKQSLCLKHFGATKKTFVGDFSVQVYCLAAISELRGALLKVLTWDVVNPGSVPCYGVRIWTRHSRDLKSDLPFPWGSNLTLDYWLSGVSVLVCFFTDKRTGLRLAPRDISWQRTLSAKRTSQKNKNITLIHYPLQPYLQHPTGKVTTQTWHFLLQGKHWMYLCYFWDPDQMVWVAHATWWEKHSTILSDSEEAHKLLHWCSVLASLCNSLPSKFLMVSVHCMKSRTQLLMPLGG